jgi:ATP-binding cassette subfamily A (ABC1) protein 3
VSNSSLHRDSFDSVAVRAVLVSVNLFNLLCDGLGSRSSKPYSDILQFGGPILYMVVQTLFAFAILVYVDSGSPIPALLRGRRKNKSAFKVEAPTMVDVLEEKERLERGTGDALQIARLTKRFGRAEGLAVDDVSFGVSEGDTFALIGPNGAGKTTTLACIRGVVSGSARRKVQR